MRPYIGRKYNNQKISIDGRTFDSKKEATRYSELRLLERAGEISGLECQKKFILIPSQKDPETRKVIERECAYIADFVYMRNGELIVEDTKGFRTKDYIIKRKLMLSVHGIRIMEV